MKVAGANPFEGFIPLVPEGSALDFGSAEFQQLESQGEVANRIRTVANLQPCRYLHFLPAKPAQ